MSESSKKTKIELEKEESRLLRGSIAEDLQSSSTSFNLSNLHLLKFHGLYQQDDRDLRPQLLREKKEKAFSFMIRTKIPGGRLKPNQYLALDDLAAELGGGSLRITTRQCLQFHGVLKKDLKQLMKGLQEVSITTLGACGDIVRNLVCTPAPFKNPAYVEVQDLAQEISDKLLPKTKAYFEIWLDGQKVEGPEEEVLYGQTYLPRKFKVGFAFPEDNSIDVYTQDIGIIPVTTDDAIRGFNVVVGGGMGATHRIETTYPLLAKQLGFVEKEKLMKLVETLIEIQRDFGNRVDRKRARMKYLVEERGLAWLQEEIANRAEIRMAPSVEIPWKTSGDYLGWHEDGRGKYFYGLYVENGRIRDHDNARIRAGIRELVETFRPQVYLTAQQNILFDGFEKSQMEFFEQILEDYGMMKSEQVPLARKMSMACPALPTCGLAIAESERALPSIIRAFEREIDRLGLQSEAISFRMTGCPNGCARPYTSEIGLVGSGPDAYALYLGGDVFGERLNHKIFHTVKTGEIVAVLTRVLEIFKEKRQGEESFGDFCDRLGVDILRQICNLS